MDRSPGFTLVELLVSLTLLALISVFAIPKILTTQQNERFNAVAKEGASAIGTAYQLHKAQNTVGSATQLSVLSQYLNYVAHDTTSLIDSYPGQGSLDCASWDCYKMANGSIIAFDGSQNFGSTDNLAVSYFFVDPDGVYSGGTTGPGKSVCFFIYLNGRITSQEHASNNSHDTWGTIYYTATQVGKDPSWFSW